MTGSIGTSYQIGVTLPANRQRCYCHLSQC